MTADPTARRWWLWLGPGEASGPHTLVEVVMVPTSAEREDAARRERAGMEPAPRGPLRVGRAA